MLTPAARKHPRTLAGIFYSQLWSSLRQLYGAWVPFLECFQDSKAIFSSSVPKNGEVYAAESSCMKGTSVHIKIM